MESNHLPIGYRPIARPESFAGMEPGVGIEPTYPVYRTGASPQMLTRRTHLEPKRGFELRSGRYERPVLPIELLRLERVRRIELRWLDWQSSAQPMSHTRLSLSRIVKELVGDPGLEPGVSCGFAITGQAG